MIDFVYFDVGGTLLDPYPSVGAVYAAAGAEFGLSATAEALERAFKKTWQSAGAIDVGLDNEQARDWWRKLVFKVFDLLNWSPAPEVREACFQRFFEAFEDPGSWWVYDDVRPTLDVLDSVGIGVGLLSNWDFRLPKLLDDLHLRHRFDPILISAFEGLAKPDPAFFNLAIRRAKRRADQIAYIGDREDLDLIPALNAGMKAYLIDRRSSGASKALTELIPKIYPRRTFF